MSNASLRQMPGQGRKPRVALMGEFSAGKSTLSNLLIGAPALPMQVTATQLPPVWIQYGQGPATRVDLDGEEHPVDLSDVGDIPLDETKYIRVLRKSELLSCCDLIDMPGISDPNMEAEVWQRMLPESDAVIWCSHATQAWRQSEAAVWEMVPPSMYEQAILLLTRFDKITDHTNRQRVIRRVEKETRGLFKHVFPISLTDALASANDRQAWEQSGAEAFVLALIDMVHEMTTLLGSGRTDKAPEMPPADHAVFAEPEPESALPKEATPEAKAEEIENWDADALEPGHDEPEFAEPEQEPANLFFDDAPPDPDDMHPAFGVVDKSFRELKQAAEEEAEPAEPAVLPRRVSPHRSSGGKDTPRRARLAPGQNPLAR